MSQTGPSWPELPTLVIVTCAPTCLYISALYFDSQALSLTWFSISTFLKAPLVPPLSLIYYISHSELSLAILETSTPSSTRHQFTLSTSRTIKARWSLNTCPWISHWGVAGQEGMVWLHLHAPIIGLPAPLCQWYYLGPGEQGLWWSLWSSPSNRQVPLPSKNGGKMLPNW